MRANKHLLLWSSVIFLAVLVTAAVREMFFQDWRQIQRAVLRMLTPAEAAAFKTDLRQIVVPEVGAMDRCVSCHVGMAPGETGVRGDRLYGAHADVFHDPAEFGCTVCHGGQGRATSTAEAHGDVPYWPRPMLSAKYSYAGCGTCHAFASIPPRDRLDAGEAIVEKQKCRSCHRMDRSERASEKATAPDLSLAGRRRIAHDWAKRHDGVRPLGLGPEEIALVTDFLASRVGATPLVRAQATFNQRGCRGCHRVGSSGGDLGPNLSTVGLKDPGQLPLAKLVGARTLENFFREHFRDPARVVAGSRMPRQELSDADIEALTFYVLSLRRQPWPTPLWPNDRIRVERLGEEEFVDDGASRFQAYCTGCHGPGGKGGMANPNSSRKDFPSLHQMATRFHLFTKKDVAAVISDLREHGDLSAKRPLGVQRWNITLAQYEMVRNVIANGNPSGRADPKGVIPIDMPSWGKTFSAQQIRELVIHLLSKSEVEDSSDDDDDSKENPDGGSKGKSDDDDDDDDK